MKKKKCKIMTQPSRLNHAQYGVLNALSCINQEEDVKELKSLIVQFLNSRLQKELNRLWKNGTLTEEKVQQWGTEHMRTPYKQMKPFLLILAIILLPTTVYAQTINGDPNHNGDLDVEDITLLINGYLTGEKEILNDKDLNKENGHEFVDLGLSVKWATMNIGANFPEEYGNNFAWGEPTGKPLYTPYDWYTYKWNGGSSNKLTKYNNNSKNGIVDNLITLDLEDDAANTNWGGTWRMPTYSELSELKTKCIWNWAIQNGVNGYRVTSSNGNSIFLPAAGYFLKDSPGNGAGNSGYYWCSSLNPDNSFSAWGVSFDSDGVYWSCFLRYYGQRVRSVCP
ncbi:MAG: hypothetical protein IJT97_07505 [Bacteroidaceae bacterium]|nr:hypothetical protein [Bacteroidaceae bacterium]